MNTTNMTGSGQQINLCDRRIRTETRECKGCGEEYEALATLSGVGASHCPDCSEPWTGVDLSNQSVGPGVAFETPLMEYGPLSHDPP